jgi:hypothetical protein
MLLLSIYVSLVFYVIAGKNSGYEEESWDGFWVELLLLRRKELKKTTDFASCFAIQIDQGFFRF